MIFLSEKKKHDETIHLHLTMNNATWFSNISMHIERYKQNNFSVVE